MRVERVFTFFFKSLSGRGEVKGDGDILGLLVIGSPAVFETFLLLELIKGREVSPHERILDPTNLASGAMLVPDSAMVSAF